MDNTPQDKPASRSLPVLPDPAKIESIVRRAEAMHRGPSPSSADPPAVPQPNPPVMSPQQTAIRDKVIQVLRGIYDPEIPVNIYELGLIYSIDVGPSGTVAIKMTLTAPACPVAESLPIEVESKVQSIPEVPGVDVELVWDPPWSQERMSEAARLQLGLM